MPKNRMVIYQQDFLLRNLTDGCGCFLVSVWRRVMVHAPWFRLRNNVLQSLLGCHGQNEIGRVELPTTLSVPEGLADRSGSTELAEVLAIYCQGCEATGSFPLG